VLILAKEDPFEDRAPFSREPGCDATREPAADAVGVAADSAAPADDPPVAPLVEPPRGGPRQAQPCAERDDRSLRGRAADRELEEHLLAERESAEPAEPGGDAQVELTASRRACDDRQRFSGLTHTRQEHARVERIQACAAPTPAAEEQSDGEQGDTLKRLGCERGRGPSEEGEGDGRNAAPADRVRRREPPAHRAGENVGVVA
jgi:hypothetical protein